MATARKPSTKQAKSDLLNRLQSLLYEYENLGRFSEAKPHILWLMEIAQAERRGRQPRGPSGADVSGALNR